MMASLQDVSCCADLYCICEDAGYVCVCVCACERSARVCGESVVGGCVVCRVCVCVCVYVCVVMKLRMGE
jgi:hypothetical protein